MTLLEIFLLIIGATFIIGSFFITEKLSQSDIEQLQKLTENEVNLIIRGKMANAESDMEDILQNAIDESVETLERRVDKETNSQIMHIAEYSEGVLSNMEKSHTEITFMYSMLNEKQERITELTRDIQTLQDELSAINSSIAKKMELLHERELEVSAKEQDVAKKNFVPLIQEPTAPVVQPITTGTVTPEDYMEQVALNSETKDSTKNSNLDILRLHDEGFTDVEIAKKLNRGLGEVKFVLGLYQEG